EITRIPGVQGAAAFQWLWGFHEEASKQLGVLMLDQAGAAALPELRLTPEHWKQMAAKPAGLFFSRTQAAKWNVKAGDAFVLQTPGSRDKRSWPSEVLGIVDAPEPRVDWAPNIYGNYDYSNALRPPERRQSDSFMVAIDDPAKAQSICRKID